MYHCLYCKQSPTPHPLLVPSSSQRKRFYTFPVIDVPLVSIRGLKIVMEKAYGSPFASDRKVSGWGVYCYDLLLIIAPSVSCSCVDALNTPSNKLPLSPTVSRFLQLV